MQESTLSNVEYLILCLKDCLDRGEAPFASHAIYPLILDDRVPEERTLGIQAGFVWGEVADVVAVYTDHGISPGMKTGIAEAERRGQPIEYRQLQEEK